MTESTPTIIKFLLAGVAVLLIINIHSNRRISRLEAEVRNLSHNTSMSISETWGIQSNLWGINSRIDALGEQIAQGTRLSFDETVLIQAYHSATTSADVEVSFMLRIHTPGDTVSVTATGQDGQTHSAEASVIGSGRFTATMNLPLQNNYTFTFTAVGDSITTGQLAQFDLADRLPGRFVYWLNHGHSVRPNHSVTVSLHPSFINNTDGNRLLNVTSLALFIETEDGDVITSWDLSDYLIDTAGGQVLDLPLYREFTLSVGDGPGNIRNDEFTVSRLVIYDSIGIRYEQLDEIFFPGQFDFSRSGTHSVQISDPHRALAWASGDTTVSFGRIRIVDTDA